MRLSHKTLSDFLGVLCFVRLSLTELGLNCQRVSTVFYVSKIKPSPESEQKCSE